MSADASEEDYESISSDLLGWIRWVYFLSTDDDEHGFCPAFEDYTPPLTFDEKLAKINLIYTESLMLAVFRRAVLVTVERTATCSLKWKLLTRSTAGSQIRYWLMRIPLMFVCLTCYHKYPN